MWIEFDTGNFWPQNVLFADIQLHNVEIMWFTDPVGLASVMNDYVPGHHFDDSASHTPVSATNLAIHYIHLYREPSAFLTYNGAHWMLVKGGKYYVRSQYGGHIYYTVYGVYVHDPWAGSGSLGANCYRSVSEWHSTYFTVVDVPGSRWDDYYVAVIDPIDTTEEFEMYDEPAWGPIYRDKGKAKKIATQGLIKHKLFEDPEFKLSLIEGTPLDPLFVESIGESSDYYIVPFAKEGVVTGIVIVNAELGTFAGATCVDHPLIRYPWVSAEEAAAIANQIIGGTTEDVKLVWKPCVQSWEPEMPFWAVKIDGRIVYIRVDGEFYEQLTKPEFNGA